MKITDLIGLKVVVFTQSASADARDVGILEAVDAQWLTLRKAENEVLFFAISNVRLVKAF